MKNILLFLFFFINIIILTNSKLNAQSGDLQMQKISDDLYVLMGGGGNVAFLVTDDGVLVIDSKTSPSLGEKIINKIKEVTDKKIVYLVFTHYHGDHIQGANSFPSDAVIISHPNTAQNIEKISIPRLNDQRERILPDQIKDIEMKISKLKSENDTNLAVPEKELQSLKSRLKDLSGMNFRKPQLLISKDTVLHMGKHEIKLFYLGRAHTNGDLLVYFSDEKILHTGDLLFNKIIPYIDFEAGSDTENWIHILQVLSKMDIIKVVPGHGEITDKKSLLVQSEYLSDLRTEIQKYITKKTSKEEIIKELKIKKYEEWDGYKQRFGRNIETIYQEMTRDNKK